MDFKYQRSTERSFRKEKNNNDSANPWKKSTGRRGRDHDTLPNVSGTDDSDHEEKQRLVAVCTAIAFNKARADQRARFADVAMELRTVHSKKNNHLKAIRTLLSRQQDEIKLNESVTRTINEGPIMSEIVRPAIRNLTFIPIFDALANIEPGRQLVAKVGIEKPVPVTLVRQQVPVATLPNTFDDPKFNRVAQQKATEAIAHMEDSKECLCRACILGPRVGEVAWKYHTQDPETTIDANCKQWNRCNEPTCNYTHPPGREGNMCKFVVEYAREGGVFDEDEALNRDMPCPYETCPLNHFCHRCKVRPRCGCRYLHVRDRRGDDNDGKRLAVRCQAYFVHRCREECDDRYKAITQEIAACARGEQTEFCEACAQNLINLKSIGKQVCGKKGGKLWKARIEYIWAIVRSYICDDCVDMLNALDCMWSGYNCPAKGVDFTTSIAISEPDYEEVSEETPFSGLLQSVLSDDDDNKGDAQVQYIPPVCTKNFPFLCNECVPDETFNQYHVITPGIACDSADPNKVAAIYDRVVELSSPECNGTNMMYIARCLYAYFSTDEMALRMYMSATSRWNSDLITDVCNSLRVPFMPYIPPPMMYHPAIEPQQPA